MVAAAGVLALAAGIGCAPATVETGPSAAALTFSPGRSLSPLPSAAQSQPALPLTTAFEIDTGGLRETQAQILTDAVIWSRSDTAGLLTFRSSIFEYTIADSTTQVRYSAAPGMIIQELLASESWIVWFESAQPDGSDARLFALPRRGGTPLLVDDMTQHRPLAIAPDLSLDGADVYWSVPSMTGATWHGDLRRRALPDGPLELLVAPRDGFVIDWPTARGGAVAYDVTTQATGENRVNYREQDGRTVVLDAKPSSEPALGEGFIVFKRAARFEAGELAVFVIGTGAMRSLGAGGEPAASGHYAIWHVGRPGEVRLASPLDGCAVPIAVDSVNDATLVSLPSIGAGRIAWVRRNAKGTPPVDRFIVAQIPAQVCAPGR